MNSEFLNKKKAKLKLTTLQPKTATNFKVALNFFKKKNNNNADVWLRGTRRNKNNNVFSLSGKQGKKKILTKLLKNKALYRTREALEPQN